MLLRVLPSPGVHERHPDLGERLGPDCLVLDAATAAEFRSRLGDEPVDAVVATPGDLGPDPLAELAAMDRAPRAPEVVLVASGSPGAWLASGASVVSERLAPETRIAAFGRLFDRARIARERPVRPNDVPIGLRLEGFGTSSPAIRRFQVEARRSATSDAPILIRGEPGVGKNWLGPVLHEVSSRALRSFRRISFAAREPEASDAELFGHEPGAFPGTTRARRGLFEKAHGGSLFLEHVHLAPPHVRKDLATYLDRRSIRRVGGGREIPVDVRLFASLPETSADGSAATLALEPDFLRRFELASLVLPPLRERREDVPELAEAALDRYCRRLGLPVTGFTEAAMEVLCKDAWPGNLHELWSVVGRAALLTRDERIKLEDLPSDLLDAGKKGAPRGIYLDTPWLREVAELPALRDVREHALDVVERAYLGRLLRSARGRVSDAARHAGIDPRSLYSLMRRHGLRKEDFKPDSP